MVACGTAAESKSPQPRPWVPAQLTVMQPWVGSATKCHVDWVLGWMWDIPCGPSAVGLLPWAFCCGPRSSLTREHEEQVLPAAACSGPPWWGPVVPSPFTAVHLLTLSYQHQGKLRHVPQNGQRALACAERFSFPVSEHQGEPKSAALTWTLLSDFCGT